MLLVRSDEEGEVAQKQGLLAALEACAVPRQWGEAAVRAAELVQGHAEWS